MEREGKNIEVFLFYLFLLHASKSIEIHETFALSTFFIRIQPSTHPVAAAAASTFGRPFKAPSAHHHHSSFHPKAA